MIHNHHDQATTNFHITSSYHIVQLLVMYIHVCMYQSPWRSKIHVYMLMLHWYKYESFFFVVFYSLMNMPEKRCMVLCTVTEVKDSQVVYPCCPKCCSKLRSDCFHDRYAHEHLISIVRNVFIQMYIECDMYFLAIFFIF